MVKFDFTRIRSLREQAGMTTGELASLIGVHRVEVSRWQCGFKRKRKNISMGMYTKNLESVCNVFGVTPDFFIKEGA